MYKVKLREDRGRTMTEWSDCAHTFSFEHYFNPFNMGFSDLRVINDNLIKPSGGFKMQTQSNMEIINIVLSGEMESKVYPDTSQILKKGDIQTISAGWGIEHGEFNNSKTEFLHFLQIWILPYKKNVQPKSNIKNFSNEQLTDKIKLVISGSGEENSLKINQDVNIYKSIISANSTVSYDLPPNRKVWIQVTNGAVDINSNILEYGDGISIVNERGELDITGVEYESEIYIFSLRNLTI